MTFTYISHYTTIVQWKYNITILAYGYVNCIFWAADVLIHVPVYVKTLRTHSSQRWRRRAEKMVGSGNLLNITRPLGMLHTELWMETTPTAHSLRRGGPDDATWNFCETSRLTFVLDPLGLFIFLSFEQLCGGKEIWVVVSSWLFSHWNITKIANRMYFPQEVEK